MPEKPERDDRSYSKPSGLIDYGPRHAAQDNTNRTRTRVRDSGRRPLDLRCRLRPIKDLIQSGYSAEPESESEPGDTTEKEYEYFPELDKGGNDDADPDRRGECYDFRCCRREHPGRRRVIAITVSH